MIIMTGNRFHDANVAVAEGVRQAAVVGATQRAINTAEIAFYRSVVSSAVANGCEVSAAMSALRNLGVGGYNDRHELDNIAANNQGRNGREFHCVA
jgi:hypothetical protein